MLPEKGSSFAATRNKGQRTCMMPLAQQLGKSQLAGIVVCSGKFYTIPHG